MFALSVGHVGRPARPYWLRSFSVTSFLVFGLVLLVAGPRTNGSTALAAEPVKGARYLDTDYAFWAKLVVAETGRVLDPRRSEVVNVSSWDCRGLNFHVGSPRKPVRLKRDGQFRLVRRRGAFVLRLWGRFTTRNAARIRFRYRREPGARRGRDCDDSGRVVLAPQRIRQIPFRSCRRHNARTALLAPTGRIFWQPLWHGGLGWGDGWMKVGYACLFAANKRFKLAQDDDDDSDLRLLRLVGPYVAYLEAQCPMGCGYSLHVRDLRDGHEARAVPGRPPDRSSSADATDLELKDNASIAWIARPETIQFAPPPDPKPPPSVWAYDTLGLRQLDSGAIRLRSLELNGSTLTWRKGSETVTATLY